MCREGMDEEVRICEDEEISGARDELFSHNVIDRVPELFTSYFGTRSSSQTLCPILQRAMTLWWVLVAGACYR